MSGISNFPKKINKITKIVDTQFLRGSTSGSQTWYSWNFYLNNVQANGDNSISVQTSYFVSTNVDSARNYYNFAIVFE